MTYFIIGLAVGILIPAPYDQIVRDSAKSLWNKIFDNNGTQ